MVTCFTSCNGQNKSKEVSNKLPISKPISIGQPKIVKTQNSGKSDNIYCSIEDRSGNLWFGTTDQGVYRFLNSHILNQRIIVRSFEEKESHTGQPISNDDIFFVFQVVRPDTFFY